MTPPLALTGNALFAADLHLRAGDDRALDLLASFLAAVARQRIDHLFLLGDLFDAWLGDDLGERDYAPHLKALRAASENGTRLWIMHGNHDFLLGEGFTAATGACLLNDPQRLDWPDQCLIVTHGDLLCTADRDYQALRRQLRSADWQRDFLARDERQRREFAALLAGASAAAAAKKEATGAMEVQADAVRYLSADLDANILVHGHTHQPARHLPSAANGDTTRYVLGSWRDAGEVVRYGEGRLTLLPLAQYIATAAPQQ